MLTACSVIDLLHDVSCRVSDSELDSDPAANLLTSASEEAQKVARNEGKVILHDQESVVHSLGSNPVMFPAWCL